MSSPITFAPLKAAIEATPREKVANLLESIDQWRAWGCLIGVSDPYTRFLSPLRPDRQPGCKLASFNGGVKLYDGKTDTYMDLIEFVRWQNPSLTFTEALEQFATLGGSNHTPANVLQTSRHSGTQRVSMVPLVVPFSKQGLLYWEKRGVTEEMLSDPMTRTEQVRGYLYTTEEGATRQVTKRGFVYWAGDKPKFYFPSELKGNKFRGKHNENDVWLWTNPKGVENETRTLLICKANKDLHVWKSFVKADLMNLSAEGVIPTPEFLFDNVRKCYDRVVICLDNDETGNKGAAKLKERLMSLSDIGRFRVEVWNWPDPITKDLDGYRAEFGHAATKEFLKEKGFYKIF
jgi:hypothetical protein